MIYMTQGIDTNKPVPEIVAILYKYKIPLDLIDQTFEKVKRDIAHNTLPYNPNLDKTKDLAISDMTDKVTEPKG